MRALFSDAIDASVPKSPECRSCATNRGTRRRHPSRSCWHADDERTPAVVCRRMNQIRWQRRSPRLAPIPMEPSRPMPGGLCGSGHPALPASRIRSVLRGQLRALDSSSCLHLRGVQKGDGGFCNVPRTRTLTSRTVGHPAALSIDIDDGVGEALGASCGTL